MQAIAKFVESPYTALANSHDPFLQAFGFCRRRNRPETKKAPDCSGAKFNTRRGRNL